MKQIQIPEELFVQLCLYFLFDKTDKETIDAITSGLETKMERIQARTNYMEQLRQLRKPQ